MSETPNKSEAKTATRRYRHDGETQFKSKRSPLERVLYVAVIAAILTLGRYAVGWQGLNDSYLDFLKGPLRPGGIPGMGHLLTALILLGVIAPSRWILPAIGLAAALLWVPAAAALGGLSIT